MQSVVLPNILYLYEQQFGSIVKEIAIKQSQLDTLCHKYLLFQCYIEEGKPITKETNEFIEQLITKAQTRDKQKLDTIFKTRKFSSLTDPINTQLNITISDNINIANIYRQIVKRLHPDIVGNDHKLRKC